MRSLDGSVSSEANDWTRIVVPILIGVLFMILVMTSGGYLMQALVEEKENRTMGDHGHIHVTRSAHGSQDHRQPGSWVDPIDCLVIFQLGLSCAPRDSFSIDF